MSEVRLTPSAAPTRRSLAQSAWLVLEELAITAGRDGVVSTNARELADALGISKDTTARALQRLIAGALVERIEHRSIETGRFESVAYRVHLRAAGLEVDPVRAPGQPPAETSGDVGRAPTKRAATHRTASRSAQRLIEHTPIDGDQLELFRG